MSRDGETPTLLAADVGGTTTRLGLFRPGPAGPEPLRTEALPSDPTLSFLEILRRFLSRSGVTAPTAACLAVAGPVLDGRAAMTNHPWVLETDEVSRALAGAPTRIVNDLEAAAIALPHLPPDRLVEIAPGVERTRRGTIVVLAPGTGLGCATLCWDGTRHHPMASEGGHADFAPRDDREMALWHHLRAQHEHVSYERILSGPGLVVAYRFLRDAGGPPESPVVRARFAADADAAAVVTQAALHEGDPLSAAALDLFTRVLGAKAGNLALDMLALGGVFIVGGIARKILPKLLDGVLLHAFLDKGRQRRLLERIPLLVSLEPDVSLLGAARLAVAATVA